MPVHPVPMRTTFRRCFLVNFAVDPAAMRARLPAHLEPDLHDGRAYLSVVIADMVGMRPALLSAVFGVTYTQVVYRGVVRCERSPWRSRVVVDRSADYQAMTSGTLFTRSQVELDSIFKVEDLAYHWHRLGYIGAKAEA
jgi:hypothetical protein